MSAIEASTPVARLRAVAQYASRYDGDITDALHEALVATPEDVERVAEAVWGAVITSPQWRAVTALESGRMTRIEATAALRAMGFEVPDA